MGGPRRRHVGKQDTNDNSENVQNGNAYYSPDNSEPEMFNFVLFGGISIKVPKWWTQKPLDSKSSDGNSTDPLDSYHKLIFKIICLLTFLTRMYKISDPPHVCWDETHFGKFANHYLNGTFFFDVHPPLGKMLLAFAGWMSDYNGTFPFVQPGDLYGDHNYVGMRVFCATLGALCVPLVYLTVKELTKSVMPSILSASFILFDTGCITLSQYILLDPILMFFVTISIYCSVKFHTWRAHPYSNEWWGWMVSTGFFIACAFSVKWVGLFVILFVGLSTAQDIWELIDDLSLSIKELSKQFMARVFGLIVVPITVYLFFFSLHFKYLPLTGPGDGFFSSAFQSTLEGNKLHNTKIPEDLAYGAVITLKNQVHGSILHSHTSLYPPQHPPEQQQITGYSHGDPNNDWKVHKKDSKPNDSDPLELVRDGDIIRLMHVPTGRNLHSHNEKAPVSDHLMQVSGYGANGDGDRNDEWKIQIVKSPGKDGVVSTVKTVFRLIHVTSGCALGDTGMNLPKWGFEQREMACNSQLPTAVGTTWNVESNEHKQVPLVSVNLMAPSFFESVYESHLIMFRTNNNFKPKEGEFNSRPWHWPINFSGQHFSGGDNRVYLLGNPVIWWLVLATYFLYGGYHLFFELLRKRGYDLELKEQSNVAVRSCAWLFIGWCLHYLPFYLMGRVLYFHHYFPSYIISTMLAGIILEHLSKVVSIQFSNELLQKKIYYGSIGFLLFLAVGSFYAFRGLTYGMSGPKAGQPGSTQAAYKWLDTWEL